MAMVGWNLFKHPEESSGEVFVGNCHVEAWPRPQYAGLTTIRKGVQAFDIDGKPLGPEYVPVFIGAGDQSNYERAMGLR